MLRIPLRTWLGLLLLFATGCSAVPLFSRFRFVEADARHPVNEILCIWEAAEGRGLDNLPSRGFGGQILLFANGIKEPVKANGDVRIYVFDAQGVDGDSAKPLHQFDFPAAVWNAFLTPSNLGTTYQIFIPYTRKGMSSASCSLRVRFTPEGGLPIYSKMAVIDLGGHDSDSSHAPKISHVVKAAAELAAGEGQGIVTSDWSQLISDPQAVADSNRHPTLGISLGAVQASTRDSRTLKSLQQAVVDASQVEDDAPPLRHQAESAGHRLHPLLPSNPRAEELPNSADSGDSTTPDSGDSSEPVPGNPRHPLTEVEEE